MTDDHRLAELGAIYKQGALGLDPAVRAARRLASLLPTLGADVGFLGVATPDGRAIDVLRVSAAAADPVRLGFPIDAPYPLAYSLRTGRDAYIANNEALRCDYPTLVRVESADHACATVLLRSADGSTLGVMNVGFDDPHEFSDGEKRLIAETAAHCATELVG